MLFLISEMASSRGSTPLMAKKHVCMMVLMRPPIPVWRATSYPSITKNFSCLSVICCCTALGRPVGAVQQKGGAWFSGFQNVDAFEKGKLVASDEVGPRNQVTRVQRP